MDSNIIQNLFDFNSTPVIVQVDEHNQPWFLAKDVTNILDFKNTSDAITNHVDEEDIAKRSTYLGKKSDGRDNVQQLLYVNESGLYALIFGSKKPEARDFKRFVTSTILPTINKTGSFSVTPQSYIAAVEDLLNTLKREEALKQEVAQLAPKAFVAEQCLAPIGAITAKEFADLLCQHTSRTISNQYVLAALRACGFVGKGTNAPTHNMPIPSNPTTKLFLVWKTPNTDKMTEEDFRNSRSSNPYFNAPCTHIMEHSIPIVLELFEKVLIPAIGDTPIKRIDSIDITVPKWFKEKLKATLTLAS